MNSIHLYLHRIMINQINSHIRIIGRKSDSITIQGIITRKRALWYISKYVCNFVTVLKEQFLEEMIKLKLLKVVDRHRLQIINFNKSEPPNIDPRLWAKIEEGGNRQNERT